MGDRTERNYYMVRAMHSSESDFRVFFDQSVVAVGWSEIDFTEYDNNNDIAEAVRELYKKYHPGTAPQVVGKKVNEVVRFRNIKKGDIIIVPYNNCIRIAISNGIYRYSVESKKNDLANQLSVTYLSNENGLVTIPRYELFEDLQRRLRVRGSTVSDLYEFGTEIEKILSCKNYTYDEHFEQNLKAKENEFKQQLLYNIRTGNTNLKTGSIGLENLVKELFECEGYTARICGKRETQGKGDIDVEATKADKFSELKIVSQIKHHNGITDNWGLNQLEIVQKSNKYDNGTIYLFITSADLEKSTIDEAENHNIQVMTGNRLVEWIFENIEKLSPKTLRTLGISKLPQLL